MCELTYEKLEKMKPCETIATGTGTYPEVINEEIRWVAVRGGGCPDWAIYYLRPDETVNHIKQEGDKMFTESVIKRLVPCDEKAWGMYRR